MKTKSLLLTLVVLVTASLTAAGEKPAAGPKGGRLLGAEYPVAEFFVTTDRRVEVTFYDAALQPVDPGTRVVAVTAEPASGRTVLEFARTAHGFVAQTPLPGGEPYRIVVQVRADPGARPQNYRLDLNLEPCGGCQRAEYACTCDSH